MLTLQIISATCLVTMVYLSWRSNRNYNKERKRIEAKLKYGDIIRRRIKSLDRDSKNTRLEYENTGIIDYKAIELIHEELKEIDRMIEKYERM